MGKLLFILPILLSIACAAVRPPEPPETTAAEPRDTTLAHIRTAASAEDAAELRKAGMSFLSRYPDDPDADEVRILVAGADIDLGFADEASAVLDPIISRGGTDRHAGHARLLMADVHKAKGRFDEAAVSLLEALRTDLGPERREDAERLLRDVAALLPRDRLNALRTRFDSSPGVAYVLEALLSFARASRDTAAVRRIAAELNRLDHRGAAADEPFGEGVAVTPVERVGEEEVRYRIGAMCPLSGRYAPLGREFLKGVSVALKEARQGGLRGIEIVAADTRGDPLVARSAAERLITEEGVAAIVGCVLSSSTIAAAQVAEYHRTVLFSPVATEEGIAEIGEWIFQGGTDLEVELYALARIAVKELRLRRIAFLSVDNLRSRRIGELFGREAALQGGEVCVYSYYPEGSTDFHETINTVRSAAPEALFIASDVEDLVLILPQLSFYEFGVQLLGLSTWSSNRLLRMAGRDMEGAIFPGHARAERDRAQFMTAVVLLDAAIDDTNPFIIGGFTGTRTLLASIRESEGRDAPLREVLARTLYQRQHAYVELITGPGVPLYTIQRERVEPFTTIRVGP
jgi:ABC-type branched-subunit amino acid transport system substrate-binding protein